MFLTSRCACCRATGPSIGRRGDRRGSGEWRRSHRKKLASGPVIRRGAGRQRHGTPAKARRQAVPNLPRDATLEETRSCGVRADSRPGRRFGGSDASACARHRGSRRLSACGDRRHPRTAAWPVVLACADQIADRRGQLCCRRSRRQTFCIRGCCREWRSIATNRGRNRSSSGGAPSQWTGNRDGHSGTRRTGSEHQRTTAACRRRRNVAERAESCDLFGSGGPG